MLKPPSSFRRMICRTYLFVVLYYDLRFVSHRILNLYIQQDALIPSPSVCLRTLSIRWTTRDPGGWWRVATWASAEEAYRCRSHRWRSSLQIINKTQVNMIYFPCRFGPLTRFWSLEWPFEELLVRFKNVITGSSDHLSIYFGSFVSLGLKKCDFTCYFYTELSS